MGFQSEYSRRTMLPANSQTAWLQQLGIVHSGSTTGNTWYVSSVSGTDSASRGTSPSTPVATINYAIGLATADNGDVIVVMPLHAETIINATALALNKAGITIVGVGDGAERPTITYGTNTTANIPISAASIRLENFILLCNVDQVVAAVTISSTDCILKNIEVRDGADNKEFVTPILTTAAADRLTIDGYFHNGRTGGSHCTESLSLIGVDSCSITNSSFTGKCSTACINFLTTACTKVIVKGCTFQNGTDKSFAKLVKDTQGSSTWCLSGSFDLVSGRSVYGSSGSVVMPDGGEWRYASASSASPLTAATLWTYTGSIEAIIIGRVTTIIQGQATTVKLQVTSDALAASDLCATKDINGFGVGSLMHITGTLTDAMLSTTVVANAVSQVTPCLLTCVTSGTIAPVFGAASTGAIAWEMRWRPVSRAATVV